MSGRLLTTREVGERLGVSPETVLRWKDTRGLPARRLTSRAIRYDEDELDAWTKGAASREVTATQDGRAQAGGYAPLPFPATATPPVRRATTEKES